MMPDGGKKLQSQFVCEESGDPIWAVPDNNSPGSEAVANAIDNQPFKYLNFEKVNSGPLVIPGLSNQVLVGPALTSANDHPEWDPASYRLEGFNSASFRPIEPNRLLCLTRFAVQD